MPNSVDYPRPGHPGTEVWCGNCGVKRKIANLKPEGRCPECGSHCRDHPKSRKGT